MIDINYDQPSVQVNCPLRIKMVFDAIDIEQPVLLRRLTLGAFHVAEGLPTGEIWLVACLESHERRVSCEEEWIFRLARRVDPVPDK